MASPIFVVGSTFVVDVRASDFVYNTGQMAVVHLSSINNLGRMISVIDTDNQTASGKTIRLSTTNRVYFDSGTQKTPLNPDGLSSFRYDLTNEIQRIDVYPRLLTQWIVQQEVAKGQIQSENGAIVSGQKLETLDAQVTGVSTNMIVYGSSFFNNVVSDKFVQTTLFPSTTFLPAFRAFSFSTATLDSTELNIIESRVDRVYASNIPSLLNVVASTVSTNFINTSSLLTRSLGFVDRTNSATSNLFTFSAQSTLWNGRILRTDINPLYSTTIQYYSSIMQLTKAGTGLSSIRNTINAFDLPSAANFSTYVQNFSNVLYCLVDPPHQMDWLPGLSSLSTGVASGLSSVSVTPGVSTLFSSIVLGFSTIAFAPGVSSLRLEFQRTASSVASAEGVSSLSTLVSLSMSSIGNISTFNSLSSMFGYGISDINVESGLSSLSTHVVSAMSTIVQSETLSSLSTQISQGLSTFNYAVGISSLRLDLLTYSNALDASRGQSSLSTTISQQLSSFAVTPLLSSISSAFSYGLSTVAAHTGLSSISTAFGMAFVNTAGAPGASSLSTAVSRSISSLANESGVSSFLQTIQTAFSTNSDQGGISSLLTSLQLGLSSYFPGGNTLFPAAMISAQQLFVSSVIFIDTATKAQQPLIASNARLYLNGVDLADQIVQPASATFDYISTFNLAVTGILTAPVVSSASIVQSAEAVTSTASSFVARTSNVVTDSLNVYDATSQTYGQVLAADGEFTINGVKMSETVNYGICTLRTVVVEGLSSFGLPNPNFSIISTFFSRGLSSVNMFNTFSTFSTQIGQMSSMLVLAGASTLNLLPSSLNVSTFSFSFADSRTTVRDLLTTSSLVTSTVQGYATVIPSLELDKVFVSSFTAGDHTFFNICTLSTWTSQFSTSLVSAASTYFTSVSTDITLNVSSVFVSSLNLADFVTATPESGREYKPLAGSNLPPNTLSFNGKDIQTPIEPIIAESFFVSSAVNASSLSLLQPSLVNAKTFQTLENLEVTQSTLGIWNRTIIRNSVTDIIQFSHDGSNWSNTNWSNATGAVGTDYISITKPTFNGQYWLVGRAKDSNGNSVAYSPDGLNYYALENEQFTSNALNCTWNGQYWLAGDYVDGTTTAGTIKQSFDGLVWTGNTSGGFGVGANNFAWNGVMWVAVGQTGGSESNIQYSFDGLNWADQQGPDTLDLSARGVCWTGKRWITVGAKLSNEIAILVSDDGITWSNANSNGFCNAINFNDVKWNGKVAVAVGACNGFDSNFTPAQSNRTIAYSFDGFNWSYANGYDFGNGFSNDPTPVLGTAQPVGLAADWNGERWVAVGYDSTSNVISATSPDGVFWTATLGVTTGGVDVIAGNAVAGNTNGDALTTAQFKQLAGFAVDNSGKIYMVDKGNHNIRVLEGSTVSLVAGSTAYPANSGTTDGNGSTARFSSPSGICLNTAETRLYVTDTANNSIRVITTFAPYTVTTLAISGGSISSPVGICQFFDVGLSATVLYVTSISASSIYKIRVDSDTTATLLATLTITGGYPYDKNGVVQPGSYQPAIGAQNIYIYNPGGIQPTQIAVDKNNQYLYFGTDFARTSLVRCKTDFSTSVAPGGTYVFTTEIWSGFWSSGALTITYPRNGENVHRLATGYGFDQSGNAPQGNGPFGIAVDDQNNVYVSDYSYNIIRKIDATTNLINTVIGFPSQTPLQQDDSDPLAARLYKPSWLAYKNGNIYFTQGRLSDTFPEIQYLRGVASVKLTGQSIGFSSNVLPAIETPTLNVYTMGKGFIPTYLTSTNQWTVTPSSIVFNNTSIINKNPVGDNRIGIDTLQPSTSLDVKGSIHVNGSTFIDQVFVGRSHLADTTRPFAVDGRTYMNQLTVLTSTQSLGVFDFSTSNNQPILFENNYADLSGAALLMSNYCQGNVAIMPSVVSTASASNILFWMWNQANPGGINTNFVYRMTGTAWPFTGQHAVEVSGVSQATASEFAGLIVKSSDQGYVSYDANGNKITGQSAIYSTESLPKVELTSNDNDKAVFGVITDKANIELTYDSNDPFLKLYQSSMFGNTLHGRLMVNSVGDGAIWVTNANGNLTSGDYICSSAIPGYGKKQDSPAMTNYTVAKITMSCDFDLANSDYQCEEFQWNGSTLRKALVGCTYHCG